MYKYKSRRILVQLGKRQFELGTSRNLEPGQEGEDHIMQSVSIAASVSST